MSWLNNKKKLFKELNREIKGEISRSKRFKFSFAVLVAEVSHWLAPGFIKALPGKTISIHMISSYIRGYDKMIGPIKRRYYLILPQTNKKGAFVVKQRIRNIAQERNLGYIAIGTAAYSEDGTSPESLLSKSIREKS
jgi:hypothetical protein